MKVSTSAIKTINKNGIEATLMKAAERGTLNGRIVVSPK